MTDSGNAKDGSDPSEARIKQKMEWRNRHLPPIPEEDIDLFMEMVASGEPVRKSAYICGFSKQRFYRLMAKSSQLQDRYIQAKQASLYTKTDEIEEIPVDLIDDLRSEKIDHKFCNAVTKATELRIDAIKFNITRFSPKKFQELLDPSTGKEDFPSINVTITTD